MDTWMFLYSTLFAAQFFSIPFIIGFIQGRKYDLVPFWIWFASLPISGLCLMLSDCKTMFCAAG